MAGVFSGFSIIQTGFFQVQWLHFRCDFCPFFDCDEMPYQLTIDQMPDPQNPSGHIQPVVNRPYGSKKAAIEGAAEKLRQIDPNIPFTELSKVETDLAEGACSQTDGGLLVVIKAIP